MIDMLDRLGRLIIAGGCALMIAVPIFVVSLLVFLAWRF